MSVECPTQLFSNMISSTQIYTMKKVNKEISFLQNPITRILCTNLNVYCDTITFHAAEYPVLTLIKNLQTCVHSRS
jgi:hypothetical protein